MSDFGEIGRYSEGCKLGRGDSLGLDQEWFHEGKERDGKLNFG